MQATPQAGQRRANLKIKIAAAGAAALMTAGLSARADDLSTITSRVQSQLLGNAPSTSTVQGYMNSIQTDGSWTDVDYASTAQTDWNPGTHLSRMAAMAEVYSKSSSSLYHSTTLAADLRLAMDYWFTFTSNSTTAPSSADNYGNPTPYSTNWFDNDISGPQNLGSAMALASSVFTPSELSLGQNYLLNAHKKLSSSTGQNTVDLSIVGVYSSIAAANSGSMTSAFNSMNGTVFVSNFGVDGIQADHTYHIHNIQLYMGGYGTSYINDMLNWASTSAGTGYALNTDQLHTLVDYLLDGTQWFIRGKTMDLAADGRQVTFSSYVGEGTNYVGAIQDALTLGSYRTAELNAFLSRENNTISSGQASSTQNTMTGNRYFFDSDAMVQQRPAYYASVKATSTRTSDPEQGNNQGLKNLYLGDGVNQIMVTGNEYYGIQPTWNWYRLPGTTVEQDGRSLLPPSSFGGTHGNATYAGGASDGKYGVEGFNYARYDVAAKKSWFFFDNEEVALGTAINSSNGTFEVDTTLNQALDTGSTAYETVGAASTSFTGNGTFTPANLKWVYQGGVGYFFINPVSNATIGVGTQSGSWSQINTAESSTTVSNRIFTLYINHGTAVSNGSYAYIAVPGITAAGMDAYLAANPITVLSNTGTVQAVHQSTLNMTQAAFYSAGSLALAAGQTVTTSTASALILQNQPNTLKLTASSPNAASGAMTVTLGAVNLSGGTTWFDAMGTATVGFNLPGGNYAGSSVGITLSSNGAATPIVSLSSTSNGTTAISTYNVTGPVALTPTSTTFTEDNFATLTFAGAISGNTMTQSGPGVMVLSGTNSFTGLNVNGGTVRATSAGALSNSATVNPGGDLVVGASIASPITLAGGSLNFSGSPSLGGTIIAAANTTSTVQTADPLAPTTSINVPFTGTLSGSGTILLTNAAGVTSPDGTNAFRINSSNSSNFAGTLVVTNNVKAELFGQTSGSTTPAGTGNIILTAGDAALDGTTNALTTTGGYTELNLRNNSTGNQVYGNNVQIAGTGLTLINPLGSAPANASVTLGNLQIGAGQTLGTYISFSSVMHPVMFQSVTLTGGMATFAPKTNLFGASNSTGADMYLGNITESIAGSGINMTGLRTLILDGDNTYTGPTTVNSGTLIFAPNPNTGHSSSSIAAITGSAPVLINSGASVMSDGVQLGSLTVNGSLQVRSNGTSTGTSKLGGLGIGGSMNNWSGQIDLTNNSLIVEDATNHANTLSMLRNAALYGSTHGMGIFSSSLPGYDRLAVLDNSSMNLGSFGGLSVDANAILVGPEIGGDATTDGEVDVSDLGALASNWQKPGFWSQGDFNGDGSVDVTDLGILASNWQRGVSNPLASNSFQQALAEVGLGGAFVPEPACLMIAAAGVMLLRRRKTNEPRMHADERR